MCRSMIMLLAAMALLVPNPVEARQTVTVPETYTVVDGDTLWGLARRFYGDAMLWTLIYEANRPQIPTPEQLDPGTVLALPGRDALRTDLEPGQTPARIATIAVQTGGGAARPPGDTLAAVPVRRDSAPPATPVVDAAPVRTPFFRDDRTTGLADPTRTAVSRERAPLEAIPASVFYSAPFVLAGAEVAPATDSIVGPALDDPRRALLHSARAGDRVRLAHRGSVPEVGTRWQVYRVGRSIPGLGRVALPVGTLVVESSQGGTTVAVVDLHFDRIAVGDRVRPLPAAPAPRPAATDPISSTLVAEIVGDPLGQAVLGLGDIVFLGAGRAAGIQLGDEFVPAWAGAADGASGRLQVVLVEESIATAKIIGVGESLFQVGRAVRLDRRIR